MEMPTVEALLNLSAHYNFLLGSDDKCREMCTRHIMVLLSEVMQTTVMQTLWSFLLENGRLFKYILIHDFSHIK